MSTILGSLVLGVSWFAHKIQAMPYESETPTVISQVARTILGDGAAGNVFFIVVQAATMLILFAGANTTYSAFPMVVNFVATDGYLPNWLTKRGHRLNFSNGILLLAGSAMLLILVTGASVEHLVAFYALGVFTAFTLSGLGMAKYNFKNRDKWWRGKFIVNGLSGGISFIVVIIFAFVKFNQGAWVVILLTPILVITFLRLHKQYAKEQNVLTVTAQSSRATSISRHDVSVLVDSLDLATIGAIRYARSLNPRNLNAVHFVIDDKRAEVISAGWAANAAVSDVPLILIDCPDRRLPNAAVDYAIRSTANHDVELTLLLPRRSYSRFLGRLLHDRTAEAIAAPISQLPRVVATIVPFDVERILSGAPIVIDRKEKKLTTVAPVKPAPVVASPGPVSHYAEDMTPIGAVQWRKRAHVQGKVASIKTAPSGSAPVLEIEIWDESGGITLQFLGRREIAGLEVGTELRAEGMVGEENGSLQILNPSYELLA
jgi:hypothetical protein